MGGAAYSGGSNSMVSASRGTIGSLLRSFILIFVRIPAVKPPHV